MSAHSLMGDVEENGLVQAHPSEEVTLEHWHGHSNEPPQAGAHYQRHSADDEAADHISDKNFDWYGSTSHEEPNTEFYETSELETQESLDYPSSYGEFISSDEFFGHWPSPTEEYPAQGSDAFRGTSVQSHASYGLPEVDLFGLGRQYGNGQGDQWVPAAGGLRQVTQFSPLDVQGDNLSASTSTFGPAPELVSSLPPLQWGHFQPGTGPEEHISSYLSPSLGTTSASTSPRPAVMVCEDCDATFIGEYRKGNLARHRRVKHGLQEAGYRCEDPGCRKMFKRNDARLEHYRTRHPGIYPPSIVPRKQQSVKEDSYTGRNSKSSIEEEDMMASKMVSQKTSNSDIQHQDQDYPSSTKRLDTMNHVEESNKAFSLFANVDKAARRSEEDRSEEAGMVPGMGLSTSETEMHKLEDKEILTPLEALAEIASELPVELDEETQKGGKEVESAGKGFQETQHPESKGASAHQDYEDDTASVISSYAPSVFSVQSLASSAATDLSKGSGYSTHQVATATEELFAIFLNDLDLIVLCQRAIESQSIGPNRLQRNLRRLFKQYAEHLKDEATDRLEYLASQLVSLKAANLSQSIVDFCNGNATKSKHEKPQIAVEMTEKSDDERDDEDDEVRSVDDNNFEDLIAFREFLVESTAYQTLRTQIQNFVLPKSSRKAMQDVAPENNDRIENLKKEGSGREGKTTDGISSRLLQSAMAVLVATGHLEPPLKSGMVRLRWKCRCGERFTADIREYEAGGASEMIEYLENLIGAQVHSTSYSPSKSNQRAIYPQTRLWLSKVFTTLANTFKKPRKQSIIPQYNARTTTTHPAQGNQPQPQKLLHLLACMHSAQLGKSLHQDCIDTIDTDRKLFCFLRQLFKQHRGRLCTLLSLKKVQGIYFVKFNLFAGGSVEVRHHSHCCESICECIPPQSRVEPSDQAEYRCKPAGPLKSGPPILPDILSHYFEKPSCIMEHDNSILNRLPKRIVGELEGEVGEPAEGWGIYYQEGWDGDIITFVVFLMFLIGSLLFGVLWTCFKMDVQGAFGVSAYIITAGAIFISLVAMRAGKV